MLQKDVVSEKKNKSNYKLLCDFDITMFKNSKRNLELRTLDMVFKTKIELILREREILTGYEKLII